MRRIAPRRTPWGVLAAALLTAVAIAPARTPALAQASWTTRVFAHIPAPGYPAMAYVHPGGDVFEGTFEDPKGNTVRSQVFEFSPSGTPLRTWTIPGEDLSQPHGVQVAAGDAVGRLVLLDPSPPRALLLDPHTGTFTPYATFTDLHPCTPGQTGPDCSPTLQDLPPEPDYAVWTAGGGLLVSDYQQGVIWIVPPGGGKARVWLSDARLDGEQFGTAGLAYTADRHTLLVTQGSSAGGGNGDPAAGKLYAVPVHPDGSPGAIRQLWESHPFDAPDGLAVAQSGHIYIALVGPSNQLVELAAGGTEIARYPSAPVTGDNGSAIPFDDPSSVKFLGTSILVANQSYITGNPQHWAILQVDVGETGLPEYVPPGAGLPPNAPPAGAVEAVSASAPPATTTSALADLPNTASSEPASTAAWATALIACVLVAGRISRRRGQDRR